MALKRSMKLTFKKTRLLFLLRQTLDGTDSVVFCAQAQQTVDVL